ncbi:MAG TPA: N-acetyltransferase [Thermoanaerobaculia bacterium]|nr:N-acetyltransferase [Thermoanaerobaculia bacterium]
MEAMIRSELAGDRAAVRAVNESAFGRREEADLVEALHGAGAAVVALVAEVDGVVVGHILFSPVEVEGSAGQRLLGLAPMAVAPHLQRSGIGSRLVRAGLERCRELGAAGVVVLGHPEYYPRFGFAPAGRLGLRCEYDVPPEVFMAQELFPGGLSGVSGLVRYHPAFAQV